MNQTLTFITLFIGSPAGIGHKLIIKFSVELSSKVNNIIARVRGCDVPSRVK